MSKTSALTPPTGFDDIPARLIAAWQHCGVELSEPQLERLHACWRDNENLVFGHYVSAASRERAPADRLPGWREALLKLLRDHPEQAAAHDRFLLGGLIHFLDAADCLGLALFRQALPHNTLLFAWMDGTMPRNQRERRKLVELIPDLPRPELQQLALLLVGKPGRWRHSADDKAKAKAKAIERAEAEERDRWVAELLDGLTDEVLHRSKVRRGIGSDRMDLGRLAQDVRSADLAMTLAERGDKPLRRKALWQLQRLAYRRTRPPARIHDRLHRLAQRLPEALEEAEVYFPDPELARIIWQHGERPSTRRFAVTCLWQTLDVDPDSDPDPDSADGGDAAADRRPTRTLALLKQFLDENPACVAAEFWRETEDDYYPVYPSIGLTALEHIWQLQSPVLQPLFVQLLGYCLHEDPNHPFDEYLDDDDDDDDRNEDDERDGDGRRETVRARRQAYRRRLAALVQNALRTSPQVVTKVKPARLAALVGCIDDPQDDAGVFWGLLSPHLQPIAAKSKPLQRALGEAMCVVPPALLAELGWVGDRRKAVRGIALEALVRSEHPAAGELLRQLHDDRRTGDADKARIVERLRQLGVGGEALPDDILDGGDLQALQKTAAAAKIRSAQIDKLWSNALLESLPPLDATTGRWLLHLALDSKDQPLPQLAVQTLSHVAREHRAQFAEHMLRFWLQHNGERKLRWLTKFVGCCGDDRLVEPLFEAFKGWHKRAKPKAVFALELLGALDTPYALSQVHQVYVKRGYSYALFDGARGVLRAAAQRRQVDLLELFDELTPDFGLTGDGLTHTVGPRSYTVRVATDLSLRVRNDETGKLTKSLPKARADEDPTERQALQNAFQMLRRHLKQVARQQAGRLQEAMICERTWQPARWRTLFVEHPLLGLLAQGLIWQRLDTNADDAAPQSFRISEDRSLIAADDEPVALNDGDRIRLWHPVNAEAAEAGAWAAHIADYQLRPLLDQLGEPRLALSAQELAADKLRRFAGVEVEQVIAKRYLESWNYEIHDQDGSYVFNYYRRFPLLNIHVLIDTEDMQAFSWEGSTAKLGALTFYRGNQQVPLNDLPAPLLATVVRQGEALRAQARRQTGETA